ncbi:MAG: hypothetical protein QGH99_00520 [Pseudomonadales bacterium]|jgi:hypothetical protein|nr:hypothetical protein [Pseudomonadales bacterium]MDP6315240.1 hypothetical protein [Pseudomonadales bacterium]MDP7314501.1 hypothetical protein [Pseudomonadales bacterium]MDP7575420.1 hypothetical protein [Pseudomonadales bacterium]HJP49479.1 hypothetical protein [Pseudomonadales bacterium]|tara:strand:- start:5002 stop:5157 length:156 start_codon:yes stop_codon:yes gene_type:complete
MGEVVISAELVIFDVIALVDQSIAKVSIALYHQLRRLQLAYLKPLLSISPS